MLEEKARRSEQSKQGGARRQSKEGGGAPAAWRRSQGGQSRAGRAERTRWRSSCGKQARGKARCTTGGGEVRMNADPVVNSIQIHIYTYNIYTTKLQLLLEVQAWTASSYNHHCYRYHHYHYRCYHYQYHTSIITSMISQVQVPSMDHCYFQSCNAW